MYWGGELSELRLAYCHLLREFSLRGFGKVQGFPFSSGTAPWNSPVPQVRASLPAVDLYSGNTL